MDFQKFLSDLTMYVSGWTLILIKRETLKVQPLTRKKNEENDILPHKFLLINWGWSPQPRVQQVTSNQHGYPEHQH